MNNPIAAIHLKGGGVIKIELYPEHAPLTVHNFIHEARKGFFDHLAFWRVEQGRLIQSGCPKSDGTGSAGYALKGEFKENGVDNPLNFTPGTVGIGRLTPDSGSTHFFIAVAGIPELDGKYAAFGRVAQGLDEAVKISEGPAQKDGIVRRATKPVFIETIAVETFGVDYPPPERLPEPCEEELKAEAEKIMKLYKEKE